MMHNLLSNPNQLPIDNYRRIQSTEYSRPGDLALSRILDLKGIDTLVPMIEDWNLLVKRPLNVIDRIGQYTGNVKFRDSYEYREVCIYLHNGYESVLLNFPFKSDWHRK